VRISSGAGAGQKDGRPGQGGESAQHGTCLSFEGCAQKERRPRRAGGLGQNEGCGHQQVGSSSTRPSLQSETPRVTEAGVDT
jgi:hypothetical protein